MQQKFSGVELIAISSCVPSRSITNEFFNELLTAKEIRNFERTVGIKERRWAEVGVSSTDLAYDAASSLFDNFDQVRKEDIDAIVFVSQTSDYKMPFSSNIIQNRLGLPSNTLCIDVNAGCAGFIQGLGVALSIANSKPNSKVLFIIAETLSKIISTEDRSTSTLFGDGASAIIVHNSGASGTVIHLDFYSDGANADAIIIPDGGSKNPLKIESLESLKDTNGNKRNRTQINMDGQRVFDFTLREIVPSIDAFLRQIKIDSNEIDLFLFHQSNRFILKQFASLMGIDVSKIPVNIEKYGNTSGVSIPILIADFKKEIMTSKQLLLCGYGVGLNWGNCVIKNNNFKYLNLFEC